MKRRYAAVIISGIILVVGIFVFIFLNLPEKISETAVQDTGTIEFTLCRGKDFNADGTLEMFAVKPGKVKNYAQTADDIYVRYSGTDYTNLYEHICDIPVPGSSSEVTVESFSPSQIYTYLLRCEYDGSTKQAVSLTLSGSDTAMAPQNGLLAVSALMQSVSESGAVVTSPLTQGEIYLINYDSAQSIPLAQNIPLTDSGLDIILKVRFASESELESAASSDSSGKSAERLGSVDYDSCAGAQFTLPQINLQAND